MKINYKLKTRESSKTIKIQYIIDYMPSYLTSDDELSKKIIDLKNYQPESINFWTEIVCQTLKENQPFLISCCPPSETIKNSGIKLLAQKVGIKKNLDMGVDLLFRSETVEKQHKRRKTIEEIKNTVKLIVDGEKIILNRHIFLLDDIISSGNTIYACSQILLSHGARKVTALALGQTKKIW